MQGCLSMLVHLPQEFGQRSLLIITATTVIAIVVVTCRHLQEKSDHVKVPSSSSSVQRRVPIPVGCIQ